MSTNIKALKEQRAAILKQQEDILKNDNPTKEQNERYDKFDVDFLDVEKKIIHAERQLKLDAEKAQELDKRKEETTKRSYNDVLGDYLRFKKLNSEDEGILSRGTSTQAVGTDALGGYTVPTSLMTELEKDMAAFGGMLENARIIRTAGGGQLNWPTVDDTSTTAVLVAENAALTVQDVTFGTKALNAYKYGTIAKSSKEWLQDSAISPEGIIRELFTERFGRAINTATTTADGSSKPQGVVTAAGAGTTAAGAAAITADEILDLIHSVDPVYRKNGKLMFNDGTLLLLKKLSIGSGDARPLWQPSMIVGEPATIDGHQYIINQDMPAATTGLKSVLFGDFSKFVIRIVQEMEVKRLDELFAANWQVGFAAAMRFDSELLNANAIKYLIQA